MEAFKYHIGDTVIIFQGAQTHIGKIKNITNYGSWREDNFKFEVDLENKTVNVFGFNLKSMRDKDTSDEIKLIYLKDKFKKIAQQKE